MCSRSAAGNVGGGRTGDYSVECDYEITGNPDTAANLVAAEPAVAIATRCKQMQEELCSGKVNENRGRSTGARGPRPPNEKCDLLFWPSLPP